MPSNKESMLVYTENSNAPPVLATPIIPIWKRVDLVMLALAGLVTIAVIWGALIPYYFYSKYKPEAIQLYCATGTFFYSKIKGRSAGYHIGLETKGIRRSYSCAIGYKGRIDCIAPDQVERLEGKPGEVCWYSVPIHINKTTQYPVVIQSEGMVYANQVDSTERLNKSIASARQKSLGLAVIFLVPIGGLVYRGWHPD